jgi:hypothetical protein
LTDNQSYAEFILGLLAAQLKDCAAQYPTLAKEFTRDYTRLSSAIETHGIKFALDTLVAWRKHFDQCLCHGRLTRSHLLHSSSWKRGGTVPKLFRGLYLRVFDLDGELKSTPDPNAISLIRQLLGVARKLEIDCGDLAKSEAVREFSRVDQEVRLGSHLWDALTELNPAELASLSLTEDSVKSEDNSQGTLPGLSVSCLPFGHALRIQQVADYFSACMGPFDPIDSRFRHGPGAVSDQPFDSYKYDFENWPDRLEEFFPAADFASANYLAWLDSTLYKSPDCNPERNMQLSFAQYLKRLRLLGLSLRSLLRFNGASKAYETLCTAVLGALFSAILSTSVDKVPMESSHSTPPIPVSSVQLTCPVLQTGYLVGWWSVSFVAHPAWLADSEQVARYSSGKIFVKNSRSIYACGSSPLWVTR